MKFDPYIGGARLIKLTKDSVCNIDPIQDKIDNVEYEKGKAELIECTDYDKIWRNTKK